MLCLYIEYLLFDDLIDKRKKVIAIRSSSLQQFYFVETFILLQPF